MPYFRNVDHRRMRASSLAPTHGSRASGVQAHSDADSPQAKAQEGKGGDIARPAILSKAAERAFRRSFSRSLVSS